MDIIWHGHACFHLKTREISILTDPYDVKVVGLNLGKPAADVVTVSHNHPGHNHLVVVGGDPRVITGPGEYEIKGVFITGIQTHHDVEGGKKLGKNIVFLYEMDDLVICHLGDLGHPLDAPQAEAMSNVDVLLIPLDGASTINVAQAAEVISLLEPKITIPMQHRLEAEAAGTDTMERFCRELGVKCPVPQPKLTVSRNSLPEESQIVLLEQRRA